MKSELSHITIGDKASDALSQIKKEADVEELVEVVFEQVNNIIDQLVIEYLSYNEFKIDEANNITIDESINKDTNQYVFDIKHNEKLIIQLLASFSETILPFVVHYELFYIKKDSTNEQV